MGSFVYFKTARGKEELETRCYGLTARARRLLILVDGERTREQLLRLSGLAAVEAEQWLDDLLLAGLISPDAQSQAETPSPVAQSAAHERLSNVRPVHSVDLERMQVAKLIMLETTQQFMPLVGADIRRRIENATDMDTLQNCIARWHLALRESRQGREVAGRYLEQVRQVLSLQ